MKKKTTAIIIVFSILCIIVAIVILAGRSLPSVLSQDRLDALRQDYPSYPAQAPTMDGIVHPLSASVHHVNGYVVAEIIGQMPDTVAQMEDIPAELVAKWQEMGISPDIQLAHIAVHVRSVWFTGAQLGEQMGVLSTRSDLDLADNQEIILTFNREYTESVPDMRPGMEFVIPIVFSLESNRSYDFSFQITGMYYVVDDKYVLSVVEDVEYDRYSGMTVSEFHSEVMRLRQS